MALKIIADLHTHSSVSEHAYSTVEENCAAAAERGLVLIAATDHGPVVDDSPDASYFAALSETLPHELHGVILLHGIEASIINHMGETDIDPAWADKLDFGIASIHAGYFHGSDFDEFTSAYSNVLENPYVDLIGHMGTKEFVCDYEAIIKKCAGKGKLIEINSSSFRHRKTSVPNCLTIAKLCMKYNAKVMVNSDAHSADHVGKVEPALKMLSSIDFPEELIVNANIESLENYLNNRNHRRKI